MARLIVSLVGSLLAGFINPALVSPPTAAAVAEVSRAGFAFQAAQQPGQVPARDTQKLPPGTATLRGHVYAGDTGQPLRKAQVRIMSINAPVAGAPANPENRLATTDGNGRVEFENVRAGRYNVLAQKAGYVNLSFGQVRQNDMSKPIDVQDGLTIEKIDLSLPRGGVITGRILDEFGDPVADVQVGAMRSIYTGGGRRLITAGRPGTTNDIGEFRLSALPPGDYYVSATYRNFNFNPQQETADRTGYAPTYYPGTAELSGAQKLPIATGQTVSDITMALLPTQTARITGTAVDSQGVALKGMIIATPHGGLQIGGGGLMGAPQQIRPDGSFVVNGLTPGDYTLQAQGQNLNGPDAEYAVADVSVAGVDTNNVRIVGAKPSTITGRIAFASGDPASLRPSTVRIGVQPGAPGIFTGPTGPPVAPHDDWTFQTKARAGLARIVVFPTPSWTVKAIRHRGADITDTAFEIRPGEDVSDLEVVVTDQISNVSGLVTNARGDAVKEYWAVAFARDRDKWTSGRHIRTSRGDQDGRFRFTALPAGDYLVIAVDSLDPAEVNDPELLDRLQIHAARFSLGDGETKTLDLKLSPLPQ